MYKKNEFKRMFNLIFHALNNSMMYISTAEVKLSQEFVIGEIVM